MTLDVDHDSGELADLFSEQDEAVKWMIARVISVAREEGRKIRICGQAPSDHPEFAKFLVSAGIDSSRSALTAFSLSNKTLSKLREHRSRQDSHRISFTFCQVKSLIPEKSSGSE